jgi:trimeric autotransporter adhesin
VASPNGVAVDKQGNLYFSDSSNHRLRKVDTNGIISTFAGTGASGSSGNGGQAINATFSNPQGMTFDTTGNLYFAGGNSDIRMIATNGIIRLAAGTGAVGHSSDGGYATNTALGAPTAVAVDSSGNFYLNDHDYWRIRKVSTNNIISTVAGTSSSGFSGDGGLATNASLGQTDGVVIDKTGRVIFADYDNYRVRMVDLTGIITTIIGNGTNSSANGIAATNANLKPISVAVDPANNLYVTDGSRVRMVDDKGLIYTVAGGGSSRPGDFGPATSAVLSAQAMAFDAQGNLFVADRTFNRIRKVCFTGLPTLLLSAANTNNTGAYSVTVTSPFGSMVSSNIQLTVINRPAIGLPIANADGTAVLNLSTTPNLSSRIYAATNLVPPVVWLPVYTNFNGGDWQFTDTNAGGQEARYYRVSTP